MIVVVGHWVPRSVSFMSEVFLFLILEQTNLALEYKMKWGKG